MTVELILSSLDPVNTRLKQETKNNNEMMKERNNIRDDFNAPQKKFHVKKNKEATYGEA